MITKTTINSVSDGYAILDNGNRIALSTIDFPRLRDELRGECAGLRLGAEVTCYTNKNGKTYLELKSSYKKFSKAVLPYENDDIEVKRSLNIAAKPSEDESTPYQWYVLVKTLCSFANSKRTTNARLFIGYKDTHEVCGVEDELGLDKEKGKAEWEVNFRNYIYQSTASRLFASSIKFEWVECLGHTTLELSFSEPWLGDILLVSGKELWIRSGASTVSLKHSDLLSFIRNNKPSIN